jgi:hypothetical protein
MHYYRTQNYKIYDLMFLKQQLLNVITSFIKCRVARWKSTDVFGRTRGLHFSESKNKLHAGFLFGLFFDPEDGGDSYSETSIDFQRTTGRYIPEDRTFQNYKRLPTPAVSACCACVVKGVEACCTQHRSQPLLWEPHISQTGTRA